jgi:uncharacterized membrane protein YfcA
MIGFFLASLLLGAIAGITAGLFGIGGGTVVVPALVWMFTLHGIPEELVMIMAIATSLATVIFTSVSSMIAHHQRGYVLWDKVRYISFGIIIGVAFGAYLAEHISSGLLRLIFAGFLFYVSMQILFQIDPHILDEEMEETPLLDYIVGIVIGGVSAVLGTGGGTLTVPYLVHRKVPIKNAVAISSACGFPIAVAATISYVILGMKHTGLPEGNFGYIYIPAFLGIALCSIFTAPIGAKLAHIWPTQKLKRYFAVVILIMAVKMLWH